MIGKMTANAGRGALIALVLALPLPLLLLIARFEIEPLQTLLKYWFTETGSQRNSTFGVIVMLGSLMLLPVAAILALTPVVRHIRAGRSIWATPANLLLGASILVLFFTLVGSFVVDQYPCWIGVPNCD